MKCTTVKVILLNVCYTYYRMFFVHIWLRKTGHRLNINSEIV